MAHYCFHIFFSFYLAYDISLQFPHPWVTQSTQLCVFFHAIIPLAENHSHIFTEILFFFFSPLSQSLMASPTKIWLPIKLAVVSRSIPTTLSSAAPLHRCTCLYPCTIYYLTQVKSFLRSSLSFCSCFVQRKI